LPAKGWVDLIVLGLLVSNQPREHIETSYAAFACGVGIERLIQEERFVHLEDVGSLRGDLDALVTKLSLRRKF
jgi:hypothetical protein